VSRANNREPQQALFRRQYGPYWEFWSPKAGADVRITPKFGPTDLAYCQWPMLEADPAVASIEPGSISIRERVNGKWTTGKSPICAAAGRVVP
jgi:hypothetical protein